jgi:hypothetical protein
MPKMIDELTLRRIHRHEPPSPESFGLLIFALLGAEYTAREIAQTVGRSELWVKERWISKRDTPRDENHRWETMQRLVKMIAQHQSVGILEGLIRTPLIFVVRQKPPEPKIEERGMIIPFRPETGAKQGLGDNSLA